MNRFVGLFLVALSVAAFAFAAPPEGKRGRGPGGPPEGKRGGEGQRGGGQRGGHHGRPPMGPPAIIKAIDANSDHKISTEEMENATAALKKLDKNGDGILTPDEFAFPGHGKPPRGKEGHHHGSRDGRPPRDGERPPKDGDKPPRDGRPHDGKPGEHGHHGPPHGPDGFADRFKEVDKNNDGKISKEEAIARVNEMFDKVDANGDGQIEQGEIKNFMGKMMREHRGRGHHEHNPGDQKSDGHNHQHTPRSDKK